MSYSAEQVARRFDGQSIENLAALDVRITGEVPGDGELCYRTEYKGQESVRTYVQIILIAAGKLAPDCLYYESMTSAERTRKEKLLWRKTHKDYRGHKNGRPSIMRHFAEGDGRIVEIGMLTDIQLEYYCLNLE